MALALLTAFDVRSAAHAAEVELSLRSDEIVELDVGDVLVVRLRGNASTGYAWGRIDDGLGLLEQIRSPTPVAPAATDPETASKPPVVGGPTVQVWYFRAEKAGETELRLVYRRPWIADAKPASELVRRIRVR